MKKITALHGKLLVRSRGIEEEKEGEIVVPEQYLENSDVCTLEESGVVILKKHRSGVVIDDTRYIIADDDVIATLVEGVWNPVSTHVIIRKCLDPANEGGIIELSTRKTKFAEILAVGDETRLQDDIGSFAHIDESVEIPQKMEETQDDWIVHADAIEFIIGD